jgi:serine phosphatase RsbU (regulator of sigma subunit)
MLLIIFYFFIAGWQAEKVRRAMLNTIEQISSGKVAESIKILKIPSGDSGVTLRLKDYQPVDLSAKMPEEGVLLLARDPVTRNSKAEPADFFLFFRSKEAETLYWYLVKLDSTFLQAVSNNTAILAGSVLLAYPYQPPIWESYLYELAIWKEDRRFRIFPFGLIARQNQQAITVPLTQRVPVSAEWIKKANEQLASRHQFNIGRVVAPVINAKIERAGFFAFDILVIPDLSFFSTTMVSYLFFLGLIYFLINIVITRRMVKFGSEINRMIVQKFGQLKTGIREISTGNLDYKVKVEGKDEFVELAERFNQMGDKLKESIAKARETERLEYELKMARQVQLELLPRTLPEIPRFEIAATLKTANEVGGDFYDVVALDKEKYLFTIGDVSGKGMSAAFYMAQCISLIRYTQQFTHDPREIALRLNKYFGGPMIDRQIFVTAVVGVLTVKTSTVEMVRAGHPPPILIPGRASSDLREVLCDGLGIGLERNGGLFEKNLATISLKLETGDTLVFYTDGLVEAARDAAKTESASKETAQFYSEERLRNLLQQLRGKSASDYLRALTEDIEQFYSGSPPVDDYTLLIIQKKQ